MKNRKRIALTLAKNKRKKQYYNIKNSNFSRDNRNEMFHLCKMTYTIPFYDIIQINSFKRNFYHLLNEKQAAEKS